MTEIKDYSIKNNSSFLNQAEEVLLNPKTSTEITISIVTGVVLVGLVHIAAALYKQFKSQATPYDTQIKNAQQKLNDAVSHRDKVAADMVNPDFNNFEKIRMDEAEKAVEEALFKLNELEHEKRTFTALAKTLVKTDEEIPPSIYIPQKVKNTLSKSAEEPSFEQARQSKLLDNFRNLTTDEKKLFILSTEQRIKNTREEIQEAFEGLTIENTSTIPKLQKREKELVEELNAYRLIQAGSSASMANHFDLFTTMPKDEKEKFISDVEKEVKKAKQAIDETYNDPAISPEQKNIIIPLLQKKHTQLKEELVNFILSHKELSN